MSLDSLPPTSAHVVLANELLDNLPVRIVERTVEGWAEVGVGPALRGALAAVHLSPARAEIDPARDPVALQEAAARWVRDALDVAPRVVVFDYMTTTEEMAARSWTDWLRTYRGHERGGSPLGDLGGQDITCEVALDQLAAVRPPTQVRDQRTFLAPHGVDGLVDEGLTVGGGRGQRRPRIVAGTKPGTGGGGADPNRRPRRVHRCRVGPMKLYDAASPVETDRRRDLVAGDSEQEGRFPGDPLAWDHLRHVRESGRMVMATTDDGQPVGFGGIVERSGITRLADLFVDPGTGHGVGKALLHEMLDGKTVMTTSASADHGLAALRAAGMQPLWPYHSRRPTPWSLAPTAVHGRARDPVELVEIDRAATGLDRATDHEYYEVGCRAQPLRIGPKGRRSASPISSLRSRGRRIGGSC